jgi:hypothetical protein
MTGTSASLPPSTLPVQNLRRKHRTLTESERRFRKLALGLHVIAALAWISWLLSVLRLSRLEMWVRNFSWDYGIREASTAAFFGLLGVGLCAVVTLAATRLRCGKDLPFVRMMTIFAMLPWHAGFFLAIPIGIWLLLELSQPDIRAAFARNQSGVGFGEEEVLDALPLEQEGDPPRLPRFALRKLRSIVNSVYTMFFSRAKNGEAPTSDLSHEPSRSQP